MNNLKITRSDGKISLTGMLNENSDLTPLEGLSGKFTINFGGVTGINSCGIRDWVNLCRKWGKAEVTYENCPITVVRQINSVPAFVGQARVASVYAPYYCESCDEESMKLIGTESVKGGQPPVLECGSCGKTLSFDGIAGQYFSFLKRP